MQQQGATLSIYLGLGLRAKKCAGAKRSVTGKEYTGGRSSREERVRNTPLVLPLNHRKRGCINHPTHRRTKNKDVFFAALRGAFFHNGLGARLLHPLLRQRC